MTLVLSFALALNLFGLAGDSCDTAIELPALPYNDHHSTSGYTSALDLNDPCIQNTSLGPDIIYKYTNEEAFPCTVTVMAVPIGAWDVVIYVLDDCEAQSCIGGNDFFGPGSPETLTVHLQPSGTYYFVIDGRNVDDHGVVSYSFSECYNSSAIQEGEAGVLPDFNSILDVVPNPTHGVADFRFALESGAEAYVTVYDGSGRLIWEKEGTHREAGEHVIQWNGQTTSGIPASPGVYLVKLETDDTEAIRRFVLVR
jgi:hypothetical protein